MDLDEREEVDALSEWLRDVSRRLCLVEVAVAGILRRLDVADERARRRERARARVS